MKKHAVYINSTTAAWNPQKILDEAPMLRTILEFAENFLENPGEYEEINDTFLPSDNVGFFCFINSGMRSGAEVVPRMFWQSKAFSIGDFRLCDALGQIVIASLIAIRYLPRDEGNFLPLRLFSMMSMIDHYACIAAAANAALLSCPNFVDAAEFWTYLVAVRFDPAFRDIIRYPGRGGDILWKLFRFTEVASHGCTNCSRATAAPGAVPSVNSMLHLHAVNSPTANPIDHPSSEPLANPTVQQPVLDKPVEAIHSPSPLLVRELFQMNFSGEALDNDQHLPGNQRSPALCPDCDTRLQSGIIFAKKPSLLSIIFHPSTVNGRKHGEIVLSDKYNLPLEVTIQDTLYQLRSVACNIAKTHYVNYLIRSKGTVVERVFQNDLHSRECQRTGGFGDHFSKLEEGSSIVSVDHVPRLLFYESMDNWVGGLTASPAVDEVEVVGTVAELPLGALGLLSAYCSNPALFVFNKKVWAPVEQMVRSSRARIPTKGFIAGGDNSIVPAKMGAIPPDESIAQARRRERRGGVLLPKPPESSAKDKPDHMVFSVEDTVTRYFVQCSS